VSRFLTAQHKTQLNKTTLV